MSNGKPVRDDRTSVMPLLAKLKRNDVDAALAIYRKALKLHRERKLADDLGDVIEDLLMTQDSSTELLRAIKSVETAVS